ncbi:MAG: flavodoxin-dependent (E)-4-hydroxy-3-methylbut-2-enyl-diphosphate synthase, partial [Clostridia bacterium]|nr:flavodoxin-dependent (E)-4-hydroxy-3-methylbut-2-enyl-diphosphate synthase [Clostridia bacterium]
MNYNYYRRKSKKVKIGNVYVGGDAPVAVQSMTNTDTADYDATYAQIKALEQRGCNIVRITVPDPQCVKTVYKLKLSDIKVPIVADIHFDYKVAIECAAAGIDKIRINPGNIGSDEKVKAVVDACRERNIPIRIGVNGGSLEKSILAKYGSPTAEAIAESALYHASLLEKFDYTDIVLSLKSSDVRTMMAANRILASRCEYPIHLGVTEAGTKHMGTVKNAIGIGSMLSEGIGDTLRVSLTADPVYEVDEGYNILKAIGIADGSYVNITSCPTCGRTKVDLIGLAEELERRAVTECHPSRPVHAAVMGCVVNGPGEAREADVGIAGGIGEGLLFKNGEIIEKV